MNYYLLKMEEETVFEGGGIDGGLTTLFSLLPGTGLIQSESIVDVTLGWIQFGLTLVGTIAFVAFIYAGFLYVTSFANEENAESAKKTIIWTSIGLIVILISYAAVSTLIRATA